MVGKMEIIPLSKAITLHSQDKLAELLNVTQGAIWQAKQQKRNIFIVQENNEFSAFEIKPAFKTQSNLKKIVSLIAKETP